MRPQQCHGDLQLPHFWAPTLAEPQHTELCGANGAHTLHSESANYHPALSQLLKDLLPRHTHLSCAETHQAQLDPHLGPCKPSSARLGSELAQDQQVHLSHGTAPEPRHCTAALLAPHFNSSLALGLWTEFWSLSTAWKVDSSVQM